MTTTTFTYEVEIEAIGEVFHGRPSVTHKKPEDCEPEEPPTVEVKRLWVSDLNKDKKVLVENPQSDLIEKAAEELIFQSYEDHEYEKELHETRWEYREHTK